jgi:membrane fusion protein, multidrug efflux system
MNSMTEPSMVNETLVDHRSRELNGSPIHQGLVEVAGAKKSSIMGRLVWTSMLVAALIGGAILVLYKMRVDIPSLHTSMIYARLDTVSVHIEKLKGRIVGQHGSKSDEHGSESGEHGPKSGEHGSKSDQHEEAAHHEGHQITVTSPIAKDVIITQQYVCQIRSRQHIDVCALEDGYLNAIGIREGQRVKKGDVMFETLPILYQAEYEAAVAEKNFAQMELKYSETLAAKNGISLNEVALYRAKLAKAEAQLVLAQAKLNFAKIKAPFDGIVDRQREQLGSLVKEGDILTTLSDNSVMWVYFNVPEKQYLEYMAHQEQHEKEDRIELMLANQDKFPYPGKIDTTHNIGAIEGQFDNTHGNIAFRADFQNPDRLLRHGQTGTILIHRTLKNAIVIPQRATFELLDKRYVWVLDKDDVAHQTLITIKHELEDIFVIQNGLDVKDRIVLEGVREVTDQNKVEGYVFRKPEDALKNQKFHAE